MGTTWQHAQLEIQKFLKIRIPLLINHIVGELHLAPEHDGGEDGEGDEEHGAVAANLLVGPNLEHHSVGLETRDFSLCTPNQTSFIIKSTS